MVPIYCKTRYHPYNKYNKIHRKRKLIMIVLIYSTYTINLSKPTDAWKEKNHDLDNMPERSPRFELLTLTLTPRITKKYVQVYYSKSL